MSEFLRICCCTGGGGAFGNWPLLASRRMRGVQQEVCLIDDQKLQRPHTAGREVGATQRVEATMKRMACGCTGEGRGRGTFGLCGHCWNTNPPKTTPAFQLSPHKHFRPVKTTDEKNKTTKNGQQPHSLLGCLGYKKAIKSRRGRVNRSSCLCTFSPATPYRSTGVK